MKLKNIFTTAIFSVLLFLVFAGGSVFAYSYDDFNPLKDDLTSEEFNQLKHITGHSESEILNMNPEIARLLIKEQAELIDYKSTYESVETVEEISDIIISGEIPASSLRLTSGVYKVGTDRPGYSRFMITGDFLWLKAPIWRLTDKMTFGFPDSLGFFLPTANGNVGQHEHRYSWRLNSNYDWTDSTRHYHPRSGDWSPNSGVAGNFNLMGFNANGHKGYMFQYIYIDDSLHGTTNVKVSYGHRRISGSIALNFLPSGLSIAPHRQTDVKDHALTLYY